MRSISVLRASLLPAVLHRLRISDAVISIRRPTKPHHLTSTFPFFSSAPPPHRPTTDYRPPHSVRASVRKRTPKRGRIRTKTAYPPPPPPPIYPANAAPPGNHPSNRDGRSKSSRRRGSTPSAGDPRSYPRHRVPATRLREIRITGATVSAGPTIAGFMRRRVRRRDRRRRRRGIRATLEIGRASCSPNIQLGLL